MHMTMWYSSPGAILSSSKFSSFWYNDLAGCLKSFIFEALRGLSSFSDSGFLLLDARTPIDLSFLDPECRFQYHLSPVSSVSHLTQVKNKVLLPRNSWISLQFYNEAKFNWWTKLMKVDLHGSWEVPFESYCFQLKLFFGMIRLKLH